VPVVTPIRVYEEELMSVMIGVDPHKATHTVVAIDRDEHAIAKLEVVADRSQAQRLLAWAAPLGGERTWAIESASGLGRLLAQQLLGAGEHVVDVPPTLSARVRLLGSAKAGRTMTTMRCRPRSLGCVIASCAPCKSRTRPRCCGC
jgi:transposase